MSDEYDDFVPLPDEPSRRGAEQFFAHLAVAASVDGDLGRMERKLLGRYAKRLQLDVDRANEILEQAHQGAITDLHPPRSLNDKQNLFEQLVRMVCADGELTDEERALVGRFQEHFEFGDAYVAGVTKEALEEQREAVEPKDLEEA